MSDPRVSVVIASYNCGAYLPAAVASLLAQTWPPAEVIVVDDGSTDDTPAVAARLGDTLTYIRQANAGVSAARNRGLDAATGEFIAVLDADDLCAPDRLEKQVNALLAAPDAAACVSGHWRYTDAEPSTGGADGNPKGAAADVAAFWADLLLTFPPTVVFRREVAHGLRYPVGVTTGEDMLFLGTLRSRGRFVVVPDRLYGYRTRPGSATSRHTEADSFRQRFEWAKTYREAFWPEGSDEALEERFWRLFAGRVGDAYWGRRREQFLHLRAFLRANWPPRLALPAESGWKWYPGWAWRAKGWADRVRSGGRA